MNKAGAFFAAMAAMGGFGNIPMLDRSAERLKGVDIEKEYELIQQKKSNLPASLRRVVVYMVEKQRNEK